MKAAAAIREMKALADPKLAEFLPGFFKTGPGEYGEGDKFLGVKVPYMRKLAKSCRDMELPEISNLLDSKWHEVRALGFIVLTERYERGNEAIKREAVDYYRSNFDKVNNWDLVDMTAHKILGAWLKDRSRKELYKLAKSKVMWERRIAIVSTFAFIRTGDCDDTYALSDILLHDKHDLMHKAVGWMLREAGKKTQNVKLEMWLQAERAKGEGPRHKTMPRTMLRYAIERFPEVTRKRYLKGLIS